MERIRHLETEIAEIQKEIGRLNQGAVSFVEGLERTEK